MRSGPDESDRRCRTRRLSSGRSGHFRLPPVAQQARDYRGRGRRAVPRARESRRQTTLVIRVDDDGKGTVDTPPVPGVGLLGMRERVTALGGHLRAEPRSEGGFTVHAELPVEQSP